MREETNKSLCKRKIWFALITAGFIALGTNAVGEETGKGTKEQRVTTPAGALSNAAEVAYAADTIANTITMASPQPLRKLADRPALGQAMASRPGEINPESDLTQLESGNPKFFFPSDQSLAGLIGKSEVPVYIGPGSELSKTLAGYAAMGDGPISKPGSANIEESIKAGRNFSRDVLIADARRDQAKAQTGQALGQLLPSAGFRASGGSERSSPSLELDSSGVPKDAETHWRNDTYFFVRQALFDLPGYFDWRRRGFLEKASGENYRASDGDAYLATVNAYLNLVSTRLISDMTRDFEAQLSDLQAYIEKRARAGASSVSDMERVRARRESAISSRIEQESAHVTAGLEFARLTNWIPQRVRVPQLADIGAAAVPEKLETAVSLAMTNNPEVASLKLEMKAADKDKSVGRGLFLPKFNLEYSDTYSNHAGGAVDGFNCSADQRDKRLMVVMNWNLLSGGSDYNYYKEREAKYRELQYRLDDQRRRTTQNLSTNYGVLANTKERLALGYNELKSISIAAEAMSKRMLSGNQSLLDLLDVYDRYYQARVNLVNLHIQEMTTVAQTVRLLQSYPSQADLRISNLNQAVTPENSAAGEAASVKDSSAALSKRTSSSTSSDAGIQDDNQKEGQGLNAQ